jgi:hypothetical protein
MHLHDSHFDESKQTLDAINPDTLALFAAAFNDVAEMHGLGEAKALKSALMDVGFVIKLQGQEAPAQVWQGPFRDLRPIAS